jgi:hypothetical protein
MFGWRSVRRSLIDQVDSVFPIVEGIHARESVRLPAVEGKRVIVEAPRPARFSEGRGYYFIDDMQGQISSALHEVGGECRRSM